MVSRVSRVILVGIRRGISLFVGRNRQWPAASNANKATFPAEANITTLLAFQGPIRVRYDGRWLITLFPETLQFSTTFISSFWKIYRDCLVGGLHGGHVLLILIYTVILFVA